MRRSHPIDWRIVDVTAASVLVSITVAVGASNNVGAVDMVAGLAAVATVAWRQQAPAIACLVALVGSVIVRVHVGPGVRAKDFGIPQIALALDYYALGGRRAERGWEPLTALLLAVAVPAQAIAPGLSDAFVVVVRVVFFVALPFAGGRAIVSRSAMTADHRRLEREQREQARRVAGEERARVARELHDIVAHSVSVMVIHAVAARDVADRNRDVAREALQTGAELRA